MKSNANLTKRFKWQYMQADGEILPDPRFGHSSVMLQNHLLIFGGKSTLTKICEDMLIYDIRKNIWQKICLRKRPKSRQDASMINKNEVLYLFGGRNTLKNEFFNDLWKFDFKKFRNSEKINIDTIENEQIETFGEVSM